MWTSLVGAGHARASHAERFSRSQHLVCMKFTKGDLCAIAGGLGLAAVQLAKAAGANVLATAGSVQKRMHLREQGVQNVVSSRTLQFAEHFGSSESAQPSIILNSLTSPGSSSPFPSATVVESKRGC
jgi:D-arabinose 1-dehydrogenase-like Zn-dependent alcohol dehydrogenase